MDAALSIHGVPLVTTYCLCLDCRPVPERGEFYGGRWTAAATGTRVRWVCECGRFLGYGKHEEGQEEMG